MTHILKALKNPAWDPMGWLGRGVRPQLSPAIIDVRCPQLKFKLKKTQDRTDMVRRVPKMMFFLRESEKFYSCPLFSPLVG